MFGEEHCPEKTVIQFRSASALFKALDQLGDKGGDFAVAKGVSAVSFAAIEKAREARGTHERFHYRPDDQQLLISRPTSQHESAYNALGLELAAALSRMGVSTNRFKLMGATTFKGSGGGSGEGDQIFLPRLPPPKPNVPWPTLVIEVGVTQSPTDLKRKMAWWFAASDHQVKIVLLVKVVRSTRTLLIDKYIKHVPQSRPGAIETRSISNLVPQLQQSITATPRPNTPLANPIYDVIGAPLLLEFSLLFGRPADPAQGERDVELPADSLALVAELTFE